LPDRRAQLAHLVRVEVFAAATTTCGNYDGSWTEWGNLIGSPIVNETASKPKAVGAN